ncbi:MAG: DUF1987 domain-containing protein [Bacteroidales bacterium]
MVTFFKKATKTTPAIRINTAESLFEMEGVSRPEDVRSFYGETIQALKMALLEHKVQSNPFVLSFKMYYFNSSSAKFIADMMIVAKEAHEKGIPCEFRWYYHQDDEDMLEVGEDFCEMAGVEFHYIMIQP